MVVDIRERILGAGVAHLLQIALDGLHLKHGVGLGGAVEQAHVLRVGEHQVPDVLFLLILHPAQSASE